LRFGTYYRSLLIKKLELTKLIRPTDRVLDIGCYDGTFLQSLDVKDRVGIDLEAIRQRNVYIVKAAAEYVPFNEESMSVITAFDVLEHVKNHSQLISQIKTVLKKGGLFILTTPHEKENYFPRGLKNWLNFSRWGHVRSGYTQKTLQKLFHKDWEVIVLCWNSGLSNLLYFPLQFSWKLSPNATKLIINPLIKIEYMRMRKNSLPRGHLVVIAKKQ
jgi:2-polyprenyl-3-methyl-5-hydroxy-6-metoxy-1,4-benzoquinol methylase